MQLCYLTGIDNLNPVIKYGTTFITAPSTGGDTKNEKR